MELTAETIDYQDTGGDGPVLVLLAGVLMRDQPQAFARAVRELVRATSAVAG
jgi:hypothetical protein